MSVPLTLSIPQSIQLDVEKQEAKNMVQSEPIGIVTRLDVAAAATEGLSVVFEVSLPENLLTGWMFKLQRAVHTVRMDQSGGAPTNVNGIAEIYLKSPVSTMADSGYRIQSGKDIDNIACNKLLGNTGPYEIIGSNYGFMIPQNTFTVILYSSATCAGGITCTVWNMLKIELQFAYDIDLYNQLLANKVMSP